MIMERQGIFCQYVIIEMSVFCIMIEINRTFRSLPVLAQCEGPHFVFGSSLYQSSVPSTTLFKHTLQ